MSDEPHDKGHRQRLKTKYADAGIHALHDYEILELLLFHAIPVKDVKPLAKDLLKKFGRLKSLMDADPKEIEAIPGAGPATAILIKLVKDIGAIYLRERAEEKPQIASTRELIDYCMSSLGGLKDERFSVIFLNAQNRIIATEIIQEGIVNQAVVYPRKVLENALKYKASAIILVHNHPSGHVKPSEADVRLTRSLKETARVLEILIHDHIIVGENRYYSFREEGIMP
jgi:DNA repair protein RadC